MDEGVKLSKKDLRRIQSMLDWFDRNRHQRPQHRRRPKQPPPPGQLRRAIVVGAWDETVMVNLYDGMGIPFEGGVPGVDSWIECRINMTGPGPVSLASRNLKEGNDVYVTQSVYDVDGFPETHWGVVEGFQTFEYGDCT